MKFASHTFIGAHGRVDLETEGDCCCTNKADSPSVHAKKLAISSDVSIGELFCLARAALAAGNPASIDYLAKRILAFGPPVDGDGKRKDRGGGDDDDERQTKQRKTLEESKDLGDTLLLFNQLVRLRAAVPVVRSNAERPSIAEFVGAVEAYLSAYVSFSPNRYISRHGCGLFIRNSSATPHGGGVYECDVFRPIAGRERGQLLFEHYVALVNLDGKISDTPGPKDANAINSNELFQIIGNNLVGSNAIEMIGIDASVTASGSRVYSISGGDNTVPFMLDLDEMSLKRTMVALNFRDSFATVELETMTPARTFQRLLERIVAEGVALPRGVEAMDNVHGLARQALETFTSSVFKVTVAGGSRSTRLYKTRVDSVTRALEVRIFGLVVDFNQFINDVFPSQLFVVPDLAVPVKGDDEIEIDFANKAYGRELSVTLRTGEVFALENIVVVLAALTMGSETLSATSTVIQQVTPTNDSGSFDAHEAARAFVSTGTARLSDGTDVDYPAHTSAKVSADVVAPDNQVTGVADDADDQSTFQILHDILGEDGKRGVKRAFVIMENLRVLQEAELLTVRRLGDDLERIFEQIKITEDAMTIVAHFQMDDTRTVLLSSNRNVKLIVAAINDICVNLLWREKGVAPARLSVTMKGGSMRTTAEFTSARLVGALQFATRFVDRKDVEAFVSASRDNGLAPFATEFPFNQAALIAMRIPSPAQPMPEPPKSFEYVVKRSAPFSLDGVLYYTLRQFEEASRFAGWPDVQRSLSKPIFKDTQYEEDEEQRLCGAVIAAEKVVSATGSMMLRQKFSDKEFEHAVVSRIFQNYWLYKRALKLFTERPSIELHLMPRVVLRFDAEIGEYQLSLEHLTGQGVGSHSDLFNKAMKTVKRIVLAHVSTLASQTIPSLLPCPGTLVETQKKRPADSLRVSFIVGADSPSPHSIFASEPLVVSNAETKKVYWRGDLMRMTDSETNSMTKLFAKSGASETNAYTSNKSMFGVHLNKRRFGSVASLLDSEYKGQDDLFDVVSAIGSVSDKRGVPLLKVEVSALLDDGNDNITEVVVFRSESDLPLFFEDGESNIKMVVLQNESELKRDKNNPSTFEAFLWLSGSDIWVEAYGVVSEKKITSLFGPAPADVSLELRVAQQSLDLPRPLSSAAEDAEQYENQQPTSSKSSRFVDLTTEDEDEDVDDKLPKKRRVQFVSVEDEPNEQQTLEDYANEGQMALDEQSTTDGRLQPPPPSSGVKAPKSRKPAVTVKNAADKGRIAVRQTGETLVAQPVKIEISDHGFELVSKKAGFKERSSDALVVSQQALFLHPTYPKMLDAENLNQENFLDAIAQNFVHLMPRRSAKVLRKISSEKLKLLDKINAQKSLIQSVAKTNIEALKKELEQARLDSREGRKSKDEVSALVIKVNLESERIQRDADVEIEKKEAELYKDYSAKLVAEGKKAKSPPKRGGGDDDSGNDDSDLIDADLDEALAHTYEIESDLADAEDLTGVFFVDGVEYNSIYDFVSKMPDFRSNFEKVAFAARARVMQNRALYLSVLAMNKRAIQFSGQALLKLVPMVGKGVPESDARKELQKFLDTEFRLSDPYPATKPLSSLRQANQSLVVTARRIRLTGTPVPSNVTRAVLLVDRVEVATYIGNRQQFFGRTTTLKLIDKLLSKTIEVIDTAGAKEVPDTDVDGNEAETEKAMLKEVRLSEDAVKAARDLYNLDMANVDIVVAMNNGNSVEGILIGGFVDDPQRKTHTFEVASIDASTHQAAARLLNYAEHALKYLDVAQSNGRRDSRPLSVNVIDLGLLNTQAPNNYVNVSYEMQMRGYAKVDLETVNSSAWTLGVDNIVDRVNYLAADKYSTLYLDWLERDVVTREQWKDGPGRSFPLVVDGRLVTFVEKNEETGENEESPVRVWREAPHPFFVPEKATFQLQEHFVEEGSLEPNTYLTVKCYTIDDSGESRKLIYSSAPAPDWIKLNKRVAMLPFSNWFGDFVANNPETYVTKDVRKQENEAPKFENAEEDLLLNNIDAVLTSIAERNKERKIPVPEGADPRLAGASDEEVNNFNILNDALADLREGMRYIGDNKDRDQDSRLVKFNPDTHVDWAPNKYLLANSTVDFVEPRSVKLNKHEIGTLDSLTKTWSNRAAWDAKPGLNMTEPLNQPYKPATYVDTVKDGAPTWRQLMARTGEIERWRVFMNKYRPPQPYTHLPTMLVFARDSAKTIVFEVEEQTFFGSDASPPRVIFRNAILVESLFDDKLAASKNLRIFKRPDGSLLETEAERVVGPDGETLEDYEGEENVFVRSKVLENEIVPDDEVVELNTGRKRSAASNQEPVYDAYFAKVKRANTVESLQIEINNNLEKSDFQPERAIVGAFFINAEPTEGPLAEIKEADPTLVKARRVTKRERALADNQAHMSLGLYGSESESGSDFEFEESDDEDEEDEEDDSEQSMAMLSRKFSQIK